MELGTLVDINFHPNIVSLTFYWFCLVGDMYNDRHSHKRLYTVLPIYKIQVLPDITSCRLMKYNKPAVDLNDLLKNNIAKRCSEKLSKL